MSQAFFNNKKLSKRRQKLRQVCTKAEILLWIKLKNEQLGYKFRRQFGIGPFIVDFYCPQLRLIIELDGSVHYLEGAQDRDRKRENYLLSKGFFIKRFSNMKVEEDWAEVVVRIRRCCEDLAEASTPSAPT